MYQLCVVREFEAFHHLIGAEWGAENRPHAHHYRAEVILEGPLVDEHGFLVDLVDLEARLGEVVDQYSGRRLNDLPSFASLNPSLEHFSRIFCHELSSAIQAPNLRAITLRLWENELAWASYRLERT
jgi:6-pyruvoyltetrahydropterin/6-carboxytetrahydropterin synthase